jgi:hypothetical protein
MTSLARARGSRHDADPAEQSPGRDEWKITLLRVGGTVAGFTEAEKIVPGQVRRAAAAELSSWGLELLLEPASLLLSEMVTNAYQHAGGDHVDVCLIRTDTLLRIEVGGPGTRPPVPRQAASNEEGGRGLVLVDAIANDWGFCEERSVVWCSLRVPAAGAPS